MIITDIQKKGKSVSAVYIDHEYYMNIDTQTLLLNGVKVGIEIDQVKIDTLIKEAHERRAREKALYLIEFRDHSKKELIEKIKRNSSAEAADKAAEKMEELGLVNDLKFAKKYASELLHRKNFSKIRVKYELKNKGIENHIIEDVLENIKVDPVEQILEVIKIKYKNLKDEKVRRRSIAALQRLGHNWEDIKCAMNIYGLEEISE